VATCLHVGPEAGSTIDDFGERVEPRSFDPSLTAGGDSTPSMRERGERHLDHDRRADVGRLKP
jgi:hypothetical protein